MSQIEYQFALKLRVESPGKLWQAAALRCMAQADIGEDDIVDMIGPSDDPSIADCLMVLALPENLPGCTRLDVSLEDVASRHAPDPSATAPARCSSPGCG